MAQGVINSETNVKALEYYADLFQFMPPGAAGWFYDEVNNAVHTGIVAMAINWYYFFFVHADPAINPYSDKMGYDVLPGEMVDGQLKPRHLRRRSGSLDLCLLEEHRRGLEAAGVVHDQ